MTFASPGNTSSESVKVADLANHLLIITPIEYKTGIQTVHGIAEAVEVNVYDRNALKTKLNQKVLARIGQGPAKPGKSAPWILLDATSDAVAIAKANAYLAATPAPVAAAAAVASVANPTAGLTPEVAALLAQLGAKPA